MVRLTNHGRKSTNSTMPRIANRPGFSGTKYIFMILSFIKHHPESRQKEKWIYFLNWTNNHYKVLTFYHCKMSWIFTTDSYIEYDLNYSTIGKQIGWRLHTWYVFFSLINYVTIFYFEFTPDAQVLWYNIIAAT